MDQQKNNAKSYRNAIIITVVSMVLYVLVAIGDTIVKGYSTLPSTPLLFGAIVIGVLIGMARKKV